MDANTVLQTIMFALIMGNYKFTYDLAKQIKTIPCANGELTELIKRVEKLEEQHGKTDGDAR